MANFLSDLRTKAEAAKSKLGSGLVNGDDKSGVVLYATCIVTTSNAWAANDTIELVDLPDGAVVIPQLSHINSNALGTTLTFNVGDSLVPARYAAGVSKSAGGQVSFASTTTQPAASLAPYRLAPDVPRDNRIIATVASANTITNALPVVFTIAYRAKA